MAKNEAKIRFTAETGDFNNSIKKSKDQMSLLNAEMKLNETQMKATGTSVEGLEKKQKLLTEKQKEQQSVVDALNGKLEKAVECFGKNSTEATKLRTQLVKAQTEEEKLSQAVDRCNDELEEQRKAANTTEKANDELADSLDDVGDEAKDAGDGFTVFKGMLANLASSGVQAAISGIKNLASSFLDLAESTKETRTAFANVEHAFESAGADIEVAGERTVDVMYGLTGILGDADRAAESASFLAKYSEDSKDLQENIRILTGVFAEYGVSIPTEGLAEGIAATSEMGVVQGVLADALEWQGVNLDEYNEKLATMSTAEERAAYIQKTLSDIYGESADRYRENNEALIEYNEAQLRSDEILSEVGEKAMPISTAFKNMGSTLLMQTLPAIDKVSEGLMGIMDGTEGSADVLAEGLGEGLNTLVSGFSQAMPKITETLGSLFPAILTMLSSNLPMLASSLGSLAVELISGLSNQLPTLVTSLVSVISTLLTSLGEQMPTLIPILVTGILDAILALFQNADQLVDSAIALIEGLVQGVLLALPILIEMLPQIVQSILDALLNGEASLIDMMFEILPEICLAILAMLPDIIVSLVQIVGSIGSFLFERIGTIMSGIWTNIKEIFSGVSTWFKDKVTGPLVEKFSDGWKKLKEGAKNAWQGVKDVFGKVGTFFKDTFSKAWQKVKDVFSTGGKIFDGIKDGIASAFKSIVNKIISGINKVVSVPFNAINSALGKIRNVSILKKQPFSFLPTISVPKIPLLAEGGILTKPTLNIAGEAGPEAIIPIDKLQAFMYGALERSFARDNISQLVAAVEDLANRPIELSINGQKFAVATAADTDTVNGGRMILKQRGLAL